MSESLRGMRVRTTDAASGIGRALAHRATQLDDATISDVDEGRVRAVADEVRVRTSSDRPAWKVEPPKIELY